MDELTLLTNQIRSPAVKKSQIREYLSPRFFQYFLSANAAEPNATVDESRSRTFETGLTDEE
jgi:hypothetical protein